MRPCSSSWTIRKIDCLLWTLLLISFYQHLHRFPIHWNNLKHDDNERNLCSDWPLKWNPQFCLLCCQGRISRGRSMMLELISVDCLSTPRLLAPAFPFGRESWSILSYICLHYRSLGCMLGRVTFLRCHRRVPCSIVSCFHGLLLWKAWSWMKSPSLTPRRLILSWTTRSIFLRSLVR